MRCGWRALMLRLWATGACSTRRCCPGNRTCQLSARRRQTVFFFQAEDGIQDGHVTGVQTCALPILGAAPDIMLGSVHAVTETGSLLAASMSGSQLGPYVSGAGRVIFVVGTQKIVRDVEEGLLRRSEERRVGKECRCTWSPEQQR